MDGPKTQNALENVWWTNTTFLRKCYRDVHFWHCTIGGIGLRNDVINLARNKGMLQTNKVESRGV